MAEESGLGVPAVRRMDLADSVPSSSAINLDQIKKTLESQGVGFIGSPDDRPGVRLAKSTKS